MNGQTLSMPASRGESLRSRLSGAMRRLRREDDGAMNANAALGIVGVIIGAVVGITVLAALAPTYFTSLSDMTSVFTDVNTSTGNADADALLPVFSLLAAFAGLFAIVGLVIYTVKLRKSA